MTFRAYIFQGPTRSTSSNSVIFICGLAYDQKVFTSILNTFVWDKHIWLHCRQVTIEMDLMLKYCIGCVFLRSRLGIVLTSQFFYQNNAYRLIAKLRLRLNFGYTSFGLQLTRQLGLKVISKCKFCTCIRYLLGQMQRMFIFTLNWQLNYDSFHFDDMLLSIDQKY